MKSVIRFALVITTLIIIHSCSRNNDRDKPHLPQPVAYTVIQKSAFFNKKNMSFSIDSLNNTLFIHLTINQIKDLPFPVNSTHNDTLTNTAFHFDLYSNGKLISSDYCSLKNTLSWRNDSSQTSHELSLLSDTINLMSSNNLTIEIPFYAFHNLKKGRQNIELNMWQDIFTGQVQTVNKEGSPVSHYLSAKQSLLNAKVKFEIELPAIYESMIYGQGLKLKNDSTFSPAGMDNTLWNSSYPDIYWSVFYPDNKFYAQTPYETSTDEYVAHDTFRLYHYYQNDSIGFGVYDHDNLSRDDGLGFWYGSLNGLSGHPVTRIGFGNVKTFDVIIEKKGVIN